MILGMGCGLWWITGMLFHVNFELNPGGEVGYKNTYWFGIVAIAALIYGIYLILAGKGRASD